VLTCTKGVDDADPAAKLEHKPRIGRPQTLRYAIEVCARLAIRALAAARAR
jgi:hypothetical protein